MTIQEKKEVIENFYKFWETGSEELLGLSTSKELKDYDRNPMLEGTDYEALLGVAGMINAGLSDIKHNFTQIHYLENDRILIRWEGSAKHTGDLFGTPKTDRTVYFNGHDILQLKNGKISELWHIEQLLQLTSQIQ